jgi:hypothetical protein
MDVWEGFAVAMLGWVLLLLAAYTCGYYATRAPLVPATTSPSGTACSYGGG